MGKIIIMIALLATTLFAESNNRDDLEKNCLACHKRQQIPSSLIYKRYLLKYSSNEKIKEAIFHYLKEPRKEHSIMPKPFFLKFPMKKRVKLDDETLKDNISAYLKKFDIKQYLIIDK